MRRGNGVWSSFDRHGLFDGAQDAVNWRMQAKSFLDNLVVERHASIILVLQRSKIGAANPNLFLVEFFLDVGSGS